MRYNSEPTGAERVEPQAVSLVNMIGYQEGYVVSREIINRKAGTITLFAFDEGRD
jgi:hypothetical protein